MKRINPNTNRPFKHGDVREDGYVFIKYRTWRPVKQDGYFLEQWLKPESFKHSKEYRLNYRKINIEKVKESDRNYRINNQEKIKESNKNYYIKNYEKIKEKCKNYRINNKDKINALSAKRRAKKIQAGTKYFRDLYKDQVAVYYMFAKVMQKMMGEDMHVDHIIPLQGKTVSGLHIPNNLQILPASINLSKSNKF